MGRMAKFCRFVALVLVLLLNSVVTGEYGRGPLRPESRDLSSTGLDGLTYSADEKHAPAHFPPRLLRPARSQVRVQHQVKRDMISAVFLGAALAFVFLAALVVIRCNCARVFPCLCGEEAMAARNELLKDVSRSFMKMKEVEEEEVDIVGEEGGTDGPPTRAPGSEEAADGRVLDEGRREGEEEKKEEGTEAMEEKKAPAGPSTTSLSEWVASLGLLAGQARVRPWAAAKVDDGAQTTEKKRADQSQGGWEDRTQGGREESKQYSGFE
ncbi:hypothetical protein NSK_000286 [Nannochloropsis salina CCMP1776]|uniref:Transmembrane protein n=1 Tax=Nannochloropsis salina CCMP1776 TaxID=1027361 RepID=A0A4D9DE33_9STRA|nr:hypothetical protein NSK_000286 [Nannochloropsis salina CCMP1776]|eukprot:TFJ88717.1 hypothetical protein NSK_000286 [Nannochloropsis salina CCMP1776]